MPLLLSFKTTAAFVISGVFSVAAAVSFTVPSVSFFLVSSFPVIYDNTVFLLKPPYLYLVINCIIVSIVATSKLTHKSSSSLDDSDFSEVATPVPVASDIDSGDLNVVHLPSDYTGFVVEKIEDVGDDDAPEDVSELPEVIADGEDQQTEEEDKPKPSSNSPDMEMEKMKPKNDSPDISIFKSTRKPPRFSQQKTLKANPEDVNKKTALGVTKPPRRQDTLETTWKKITEGRSTPLNKQLKKSDTWQERSHVQSSTEKNDHTTTKSDNLDDVVNAPPIKETHKTRLKREPSPDQEELNRRVEAFIKKFNEEMRLQRLESLAKYNEIVNGGTLL